MTTNKPLTQTQQHIMNNLKEALDGKKNYEGFELEGDSKVGGRANIKTLQAIEKKGYITIIHSESTQFGGHSFTVLLNK
jgi:hypothetical protein